MAKNVNITNSAGALTLTRGDIEVRINKVTSDIGFYRGGKLSLSDTSSQIDVQVFILPVASDLYGLGQFRDAMTNYRDKTIYLSQANMDAVNPFLFSPNGLGCCGIRTLIRI